MVHHALSEPRTATRDDFQGLVDLIDARAEWLRTKDTDQWLKPWPTREARDARVKQGLADEATFVVCDQATGALAATVTLRQTGADFLWTEDERKEPAAYLHRLVVARAHAGRGLGAALIDWATRRAVDTYGARCTRIDVWGTNDGLHGYYKNIGFDFVRYANVPYPSNALFQRNVT
ncbi:hypothetical protein GCM10010168_55860 [Actinoplanes ianthinogenes]|uniref:N-acetyltransferase domain-containing protein n=1 Tax=Actinoplanes ianthinogenes TaxID=122358 RepID=A0ABM7LQA7_9ACTN|nr:GNAT family N-acetyltransferase [Actinoplanes ianthinogenes]BCJ41415.1 hypothetical protein Aiant_20720 [Actinoplanes ianthinogenes]GGR30282.1 hypothetical protein GCM10010168_55860 [Actinoplanes ianthinogenes]